MRALEISVNATSCNVVTVPPHDVIQKKMTPWVQLTAVGTWPRDRCVWGGSGYCGEKPPHTVIGRVRLPGQGAKEGEKQLDFFFCSPSHNSNQPLHICSILLESALHLGYYIHYHGNKPKKDKSNRNGRQIIFNAARDVFPPLLCAVLKCFQDGDLHRLQSSVDVFMLSADNPEGTNAYFRNLSWLQ